jgi:predicted XRE-type DNA-binding protein
MKTVALQRNMSVTDIARAVGTQRPRISEVMYGVIPGTKYRAAIEKALGASPPADIAS